MTLVCTVLTVIVPTLDTFLALGTITVIPATSYCGVTDMRHKKSLRQLRKEALEREQGGQVPGIEIEHRKKFKKVKRFRPTKNSHHLRNRCRQGSSTSENLLWIDIQKHRCLHEIFKNDDPEYVILVLDRMMKMKGYKRFRGVSVTQSLSV